MPDHTEKLAEIIWDYHQVGHVLEKTDCMLVLCSNDLRVAERSAELFHEKWAPLIVFSGQIGKLTEGLFQGSEAECFAARAMELGVPNDKILIEDQATNTGENIRFSRTLLASRGLHPSSFLLVQKPYMERRTIATFEKVWPEKHAIVTSPKISFQQYATRELPRDLIIEIMVGDLQRIKDYPSRGFQTPQKIPAEVWQAFERLVSLGYDGHLCPS